MTSHCRSCAPAGLRLAGRRVSRPGNLRAEIRRIFLQSWLYVGHASQVPERGDLFLFEIAGESVIVVRDGAGRYQCAAERVPAPRLAHLRRGSGPRIAPHLPLSRLDLWARRLAARAARLRRGFRQARAWVSPAAGAGAAGLIFINFDADAGAFDAFERDLAAPLAPYELDNAKVAHRQNYPIAANWKLAVENYCECYHCAAGAPGISGRPWPRDPARSDWRARRGDGAAPAGRASRRTRCATRGCDAGRSAPTADSSAIRCCAAT